MKTRWMTLCALFAALTAVCAQIMLPLGPAPVSLALLPLLLCAALLPLRYAVAAAILYIGMGAAGLPVFAGMTGGPGVLLGPTGGYIVGYVVCVWLTALLAKRGVRLPLAMAAGLLGCYVPGAAWMMHSNGITLLQALIAGVLPFVIGDMVKIFLASYLAKRLYLVVRA